MFENEMIMDTTTVEAPVMDADVTAIEEITEEPMAVEEMVEDLPEDPEEERKLSKAEVAGIAGLAAGALYLGVRAYKKHKEAKEAQPEGERKGSWKDKIPTVRFQSPITFKKKESAPVPTADPNPVPAPKQDEPSEPEKA